MVRVIDGFGNPFEEESQDPLVLDRKAIATLTDMEALVEHTRWVSYSLRTLSGKDRDGNLEGFFQHENQACPDVLSDGSCIHLSATNQLLSCLEDLTEHTVEDPPTSSIVIVKQSSSICCLPTAKFFQEYAQHIFFTLHYSETSAYH